MKKILFLGCIVWLSQSLVGSQQVPNDTEIWTVHGAAGDEHAYQSLIMLCEQCKINELKKLLLKGEIHPDRARLLENGRTLIMYAIKHRQYDVLRTLLEEGKADPNIQDKNGNTAVVHAVVKRNQKALDILLQANANVNIANEDGGTALIVAVLKNQAAIIIKLLRAKANPNLQNKAGITALIVAVNRNKDEIVAMLLKAHADPEIIAENGKSAFDYAIKNNNEVILNMLQEAMIPGLSDSEEDV